MLSQVSLIPGSTLSLLGSDVYQNMESDLMGQGCVGGGKILMGVSLKGYSKLCLFVCLFFLFLLLFCNYEPS